ncbi:hypothetical protein BO71DRAFT_122205 [Aspergillus ellipticus CBS 707.79]|uniref:Uncharacterized protein n=1 Tax=Aspergillus ellipticus CBS 707.79 TaxID=1448320 RepID=A0A319DJA4_9EURO|nr:hypothetical protein BO71DRAFT_122205 [Aspergillus ellipticus CBS 707.79]
MRRAEPLSPAGTTVTRPHVSDAAHASSRGSRQIGFSLPTTTAPCRETPLPPLYTTPFHPSPYHSFLIAPRHGSIGPRPRHGCGLELGVRPPEGGAEESQKATRPATPPQPTRPRGAIARARPTTHSHAPPSIPERNRSQPQHAVGNPHLPASFLRRLRPFRRARAGHQVIPFGEAHRNHTREALPSSDRPVAR